MAIDVSITTVRIDDGYYSTVAGGTILQIGATPYTESLQSSGGTVSGVVYLAGDQRITGYKIFDNSINITKDVSIGASLTINSDTSIFGDLYVIGHTDLDDVSIAGDLYVEGTINGGELELTNLHVSNDVSIDGNLYLNGTLLGFNLEDLNDVSISSLTLGDTIVWNGTIWINQEASTAGTTTYEYVDGSLAQRDVSIAQNDSSIQWLYTNMADVWLDYVDGSLAERDSSIQWLDDNLLHEASLGTDFYWLNGYLEVSTNLGIRLSDLADVSISSDVSTFDVLEYDGSIGKWINKPTIQVDPSDNGVTPNDFIVPNYQYMGAADASGSWRFFIDESTNLRFEYYNGTSWNYKYAIQS